MESQDPADPITPTGVAQPARLWVWFAWCWGGAAALVGLTIAMEAANDGRSGPNFSGPFLVLLFGGLVLVPIGRAAVVLWKRRRVGVRVVAVLVGMVVAVLGVGTGSAAFHALQMNRCGAQSIIESSEVRKACWALATRAEAGGPMPRSVAELVYEGAFDIERFDRGCTDCDLSEVRLGKYTARAIARQRMTRAELDAEIARVHPEPVAWERFGPIVACLDARAYAERSATRIVGWSRSVDIVHNRNHTDEVNVVFSDGHTTFVYGRDVERLVEALEESIAYYESIGIPMPEELVRELREAMGGSDR
jgi:hypothetical protein